MSCTDRSIRIKANLILGVMMQNNKDAQDKVFKAGFLPILLEKLESETEGVVINKVLFALSSLVRSHTNNIIAFDSQGGFEVLIRVFDMASNTIKKKIRDLVRDVTDTDMFPIGEGAYVMKSNQISNWCALLQKEIVGNRDISENLELLIGMTNKGSCSLSDSFLLYADFHVKEKGDMKEYFEKVLTKSKLTKSK